MVGAARLHGDARRTGRASTSSPRIKRAAELFDRRLRDPAGNAAARARLRADVAGDGVAHADVVIEAIFESLEAKRELYARLEPRMKPGALLATNTSSIMLEPLAERLARPERLVGLHFFNPVAQMPLIEIVRSEATDATVAQAATAFARRLDKLPVPCRSAPGFMVNRVLTPYLNEAMHAADEGVPLAAIDRTRGALRHADGADRARGRRRTGCGSARRRDHRARAGPAGAAAAAARGAARRQEARQEERRRVSTSGRTARP